MDRRAMEASGVPLPSSNVTILHEGVDWEEITWGPSFVRIRDDEYPLVRCQFMPHSVAS